MCSVCPVCCRRRPRFLWPRDGLAGERRYRCLLLDYQAVCGSGGSYVCSAEEEEGVQYTLQTAYPLN